MDGLLAAFNPSTVLLVCGENDLWDLSVSKTFQKFTKIVKKIVDTGARVIYMGTKPEPGTTSLHGEYVKYDAKIRALAAEYADGTLAPTPEPTASAGTPSAAPAPVPLTMVDVYPGFNALGNPTSFYQDDDLHLSSEGVRLHTASSIRPCAPESKRPPPPPWHRPTAPPPHCSTAPPPRCSTAPTAPTTLDSKVLVLGGMGQSGAGHARMRHMGERQLLLQRVELI